MSFQRLLQSDRGQILLINLSHTVEAQLLPASLVQVVLPALKSALAALPASFDDETLVKAVGAVVWDDTCSYQLASTVSPEETLHIAAVRTLGELRPLLERIGKVQNLPALASSLAPEAPEEVLIEAAEIINEFAPRMPQLTVGRAFNFFWATTAEEVARVRENLGDGRRGLMATALRDRLGLVHLRPGASPQPLHLFLFEATAPLKDLSSRGAFRVSRPTTLDGFDNPRFRQMRPPPPDRRGWGATVDLTDGAYREGLPELVSTEIPLQDDIRCHYVGRVLRDPAGTDTDFVRFLAPEGQLEARAVALDELAAT